MFLIWGILDEVGGGSGSMDYVGVQDLVERVNRQLAEREKGVEELRVGAGEGTKWRLDEEMEYIMYPNMYHSLRSGLKITQTKANTFILIFDPVIFNFSFASFS